MSFLQKLRVRAIARRSPSPTIQCDLTGIKKVWALGNSEQIAWDQITEVFAYKRDCLTTDQIRLVFGSQISGKWLEVTEDEPGFNELITNLPNHLPGCQAYEDWFMSVAVPAFETKWTQIFRRERHDHQPES
jgi:hypothetical protein